MHDILRERLLRKIESLPEEQVYQILDYIEFLESKYGTDPAEEASGLRRFAEAVEDKIRKTAMSPATLREAFQLIAAADRVLSSVSSKGKQLMEELTLSSGDDSRGDEDAPENGTNGEVQRDQEGPEDQDSEGGDRERG